jgi:GNAT superfamily N-acetyltransferase
MTETSRLEVRAARAADLGAAEAHMRTVLTEDLGGYHPEWHGDIDDLAGSYLNRQGWELFVAELDERLAGTAIVKPGGPKDPPEWMARRYTERRTAQIGRVWVARDARRRGVARSLVRAARAWALATGYELICLHTDASVPGALEFWRNFPGSVEVWDARPDPWNTVHFELESDPR